MKRLALLLILTTCAAPAPPRRLILRAGRLLDGTGAPARTSVRIVVQDGAITAIEPAVEAPLSLQAENITQGRFLAADDRDAILIGRGLADYLEVGVGDSVTLVGRRKNESMRQHSMAVVGRVMGASRKGTQVGPS